MTPLAPAHASWLEMHADYKAKRITAAQFKERALDLSPPIHAVKCVACNGMYNRDWGHMCPNCTGAN